MKSKPSYKKLLKQRKEIIKKLAKEPFILRGSLRRHGNKCGKPGCVCKDPVNPKPHGPYDYLSHRYGKKRDGLLLSIVDGSIRSGRNIVVDSTKRCKKRSPVALKRVGTSFFAAPC